MNSDYDGMWKTSASSSQKNLPAQRRRNGHRKQSALISAGKGEVSFLQWIILEFMKTVLQFISNPVLAAVLVQEGLVPL